MRELTLGESLEVLSRNRYGHLGVRDAEGVTVVPIGHALSGDRLVAHAMPGHKVQCMRRWPHVALLVDEVRDPAHWRSVLVRGRFKEIGEPERREYDRLTLVRAFGGSASAVTTAHGHSVTLADAVIFEIVIDSLTGRAESL
jgi:nitroimidazol reductase NimA-like FMN-containing flavoprotein (pyridoxamine 5'-phosphate oxidase superfamily)